MFSFSFDPEEYSSVRRQELIREAQHYRLIQEAMKSRRNQIRGLAKILALTGRWMVDIGTGLEKRYSEAYLAAASVTQANASTCG